MGYVYACRVCMDGVSIPQFSPMRAIRGEIRRLSRNRSSQSLWILRVQRLSWRSWAFACSSRLNHHLHTLHPVRVECHFPQECCECACIGHLSVILC